MTKRGVAWAAAVTLLAGLAWAQDRGGERRDPQGPPAAGPERRPQHKAECGCCSKAPRPQPPGEGEGRARPPQPPAGEGRERPRPPVRPEGGCDHVCPHHPAVRPPAGGEPRPPQPPPRPGADARPPQPPPQRPECRCDCHRAGRPEGGNRPPGGDRPRGNNGVGNGQDPQPPGRPPANDGPGTGPGHPGNRRGGR